MYPQNYQPRRKEKRIESLSINPQKYPFNQTSPLLELVPAAAVAEEAQTRTTSPHNYSAVEDCACWNSTAPQDSY